MIGCDNKVRMRRNVCAAFIMSLKKPLVEQLLDHVDTLIANRPYDGGNVNFILSFSFLACGACCPAFATLFSRHLPADNGNQLTDVLHFVKALWSRNRTAGVFNGGCEFHKHQTVKA